MVVIILLILEILGVIAMFKEWSWLIPVAIIAIDIPIILWTNWWARTVWEGLGLFLGFFAVAQAWPDYAFVYIIATIIFYSLFVRAILRERRGY